MKENYFDKVASTWDEIRSFLFSEEVRDIALSVAGVKEGKTAVDVGAGTGFITEGLVKKGLEVIAVDKSRAMLIEMKRKFRSFDVHYCIGDAEKLPILNNAIDYVFSNMCLHHVNSPQRAIREMTRILKPGGKLVITDLDKHNFEFMKEIHHDKWMGFRREEIKKWFEEAGLKNVRVECTNKNCCVQPCGISIFVAFGEK